MKIWVDDECDGYGRCSELVPEAFSTPQEPLYVISVLKPVIDEDKDEEIQSRVIAAIHACPKRALHTDLDISY